MHDNHDAVHRAWRIPDARWGRMVPLLPPRPPPPLGGHWPIAASTHGSQQMFAWLDGTKGSWPMTRGRGWRGHGWPGMGR
jgi:hypothetical protein